jgi:SAM-dependent methyltransferase
VGAGSGTITKWLADRVAPDGSVLAVDVDPRFLQQLDHPCVNVRQVDITSDPLDQGAFDLVYARMVLMHLPNADVHLEKLAAAVRPGGWLLIQDVDLSFNESPEAIHLTWPTSNHDFSVEIMRKVNGLLSMTGALPSYSKDHALRLIRLGFAKVGAEIVTRLAWGETGGTYEAAFQRVRPYLEQYAGLDAAAADERLRQLGDPAFAFTSAPMVSAWGRRPG